MPGTRPRFDLNKVPTEEVLAEREERGPRTPGSLNAHYDLCTGDGCPCYREGLSGRGADVDRIARVLATSRTDDPNDPDDLAAARADVETVLAALGAT